jgi:CheY-like chemotaxis protein
MVEGCFFAVTQRDDAPGRRAENADGTAVEPGRRRRFAMEIVVASEASDPQMRNVAAVRPQPHRVLIVDDDFAIRESLAELLEGEGYLSIAAANGRDALAKLDEDGPWPCLIVLDLMMPVMNGESFRELQLRIPELAHIPTIVVTADVRAQSRVEPLHVDASLQKPLDIDQFVATVRDRCSSCHCHSPAVE